MPKHLTEPAAWRLLAAAYEDRHPLVQYIDVQQVAVGLMVGLVRLRASGAITWETYGAMANRMDMFRPVRTKVFIRDSGCSRWWDSGDFDQRSTACALLAAMAEEGT